MAPQDSASKVDAEQIPSPIRQVDSDQKRNGDQNLFENNQPLSEPKVLAPLKNGGSLAEQIENAKTREERQALFVDLRQKKGPKAQVECIV